MKTRLCYGLVALWCAAIYVPNFVVLGADTFTGGSSLYGASSTLVFAWIFGYLVAFGAMFALYRMASVSFATFFAAMVTGFAIDWATPLSPFVLPACVAATAAIAWTLISSIHAAGVLSARGVKASARVVSVQQPWFNAVINGIYVYRTVRLSIHVSSGTFETTLRGLYSLGNLPKAGDTIPILYDPRNVRRIRAY